MIGNMFRHNKVRSATAMPNSLAIPSRPQPTVSQAASLKTRSAIWLGTPAQGWLPVACP